VPAVANLENLVFPILILSSPVRFSITIFAGIAFLYGHKQCNFLKELVE
jgi:hypothetical protein